MMKTFVNPDILKRFEELIAQGSRFMLKAKLQGCVRGDDAAEITQWTTRRV
jgi:hypothetical protein